MMYCSDPCCHYSSIIFFLRGALRFRGLGPGAAGFLGDNVKDFGALGSRG